MAKAISLEQIIKINELYAQCGVKAEVARQLGISASTVSKYLKVDYIKGIDIETVPFSGDIPSLNKEVFEGKFWGVVCRMTDEEEKEIIELRKEIRI